QGRAGQPGAADRPGRAAPPDARRQRALPGLLLRGRGVAAARRSRSRGRGVVSAGVVVVGAGPGGLSAAIELRRLGAGPVLGADREASPGGVPRHSWHTGYGLRDLRRVMSGPAYARALT